MVGVDRDTGGLVGVFGPGGSLNAAMASVPSRPDDGQVLVFDAEGNGKAGIRVNEDGRGEVFGDVKSFVVEHPNEPGSLIVYTSLEGPEVATYHRGAAPLVDGAGTIELPEHFSALALPGSLTVQLTPGSLESSTTIHSQRSQVCR